MSMPHHVLSCLGRDITEQHDQAARARRAVAALAYVSGQEINEIELLLARHGGAFDGAAGPVRSVAARTCDLLGTAARVAEVLHSDLSLEDRIERLSLRLTLGVSGSAVDLARYAGAELTRGDYRRLVAARLVDTEAIAAASDEGLLACLDADRRRLTVLRHAAAELTRAEEQSNSQLPPQQLAHYTA
jgi:helicase